MKIPGLGPSLLPRAAAMRRDWLSNVRPDLLAGMVVALALIPEAIAFSIIAGVDPKVGLYAAFSIAMTSAFVGGRPGMISGATGAMALLVGPLVRDHGLPYLFAATMLTGVVQIAFGVFRLGRYMKFVPRSVMVGFLNALAILIFLAQLPQLLGAGWQVYAMVAAGLGIIYLLPRLTKAVPSALVAIVLLTVVSVAGVMHLNRVGDVGELPTAVPSLGMPHVPLTLETLRIILPLSVAMALVGLIESLLTASTVDEMTETASDKNRECRGQGIANLVAGSLGGMAGCAMIGQTVINVKSGGRTRLSTFAAGAFLLFFILVLSRWLVLIPMGALVAVMIMVSIGTFDWNSLRTLHVVPRGEVLVMLVTVVTVVMTDNLALGVVTGVVISAMQFARSIAHHAMIDSVLSADGRERVYQVHGQLFFATVIGFLEHFDYQERLERVVIDLSRSHIWDHSAVAALDKAVLRFRRGGAEVEVVGMNEATASLLERLALHDKPGALEMVPGH
jgi:SulP family sulfate permease